MKQIVDIEDYDPTKGFTFVWEEGAHLSISAEDIHIRANAAGLRNLAGVLLGLSQSNVPPGEHVHIDDFVGAESGSLVIERA